MRMIRRLFLALLLCGWAWHSAAASPMAFIDNQIAAHPGETGAYILDTGAEALLAAIRRIKKDLPGVRTVLGLSNISFGLKPAGRKVLNAVFLDRCQHRLNELAAGIARDFLVPGA